MLLIDANIQIRLLILRGWALGAADAPVGLHVLEDEITSTLITSKLSVLETARELAGVEVGVFGAKSWGAGGTWHSGGGLRCFTKKFEIRLGFDAFDAASAALTFLRCFLLVR